MDLKPEPADADLDCMDDRGDIVLGWLTKLVASLAVLGVLGFDAVSLVSSRFQAEDHAQSAVRAASESYRSAKNLQQAYEAAVAEVTDAGDTIAPESFQVAPDGQITLTLRRTAATMVVDRIPPARGWAEVDVTVTGRPSS